MILEISGDKISKEDVVKIGKFFRDWFEKRTDIVSIIVKEGTEDMSKEEVSEMFAKIFRDAKDYTEIRIPRP